MRCAGAKHLSLSRRLGIALAILGVLQALVPLGSPRARSSLRIAGRLRIALASSPSNGLSTCVLPTCPLPSAEPTSEPSRDQESDQESNSSENMAETFTWSEAITDRRTVQGNGSLDAANGILAPPSQARERARSALQSSRALSLLAHDASTMTVRLCRFTC